MKIYATLQIGDFHLNHCEDYFFIENIGTNRLLMAVMDGCTMARDSYFASTLVARILKKICITQGYLELYNPGKPDPSLDDQLKLILSELWYLSLTQKIFIPNIQDVSIATDGILFLQTLPHCGYSDGRSGRTAAAQHVRHGQGGYA